MDASRVRQVRQPRPCERPRQPRRWLRRRRSGAVRVSGDARSGETRARCAERPRARVAGSARGRDRARRRRRDDRTRETHPCGVGRVLVDVSARPRCRARSGHSSSIGGDGARRVSRHMVQNAPTQGGWCIILEWSRAWSRAETGGFMHDCQPITGPGGWRWEHGTEPALATSAEAEALTKPELNAK